MEDEVRPQLEQVQRDIASLEQRLVLRDAPDREAIAALTAEKESRSTELARASEVERHLEQQRTRAANRLSHVEIRPASLDAMGTVERLVVAGWSFVFIALAVLLVFDVTLLVLRDVLALGLGAALACAAAGWGLAVLVRRPRRG